MKEVICKSSVFDQNRDDWHLPFLAGVNYKVQQETDEYVEIWEDCKLLNPYGLGASCIRFSKKRTPKSKWYSFKKVEYVPYF